LASTSVSRARDHNCPLIGTETNREHLIYSWRCADQVQPPVNLPGHRLTLLVTLNVVQPYGAIRRFDTKGIGIYQPAADKTSVHGRIVNQMTALAQSPLWGV